VAARDRAFLEGRAPAAVEPTGAGIMLVELEQDLGSEHEPDVLGEREPQATPVAIADPDQDGDQDREIDKVYECRVSDRCRPT